MQEKVIKEEHSTLFAQIMKWLEMELNKQLKNAALLFRLVRLVHTNPFQQDN